jgi:hypothetical protein
VSEWRTPAERTMAAWDARCIADGLPTPLEQLQAAADAGDLWLASRIARSIVRLTGQAVLTDDAADQLDQIEVSYEDFLRREANPPILASWRAAQVAAAMHGRIQAALDRSLDDYRRTRYSSRRQTAAAWVADHPTLWIAAIAIVAALAVGYLIGNA